MPPTKPQELEIEERPGRALEVLYTSGVRDSVVLEKDDTIGVTSTEIRVDLIPSPSHAYAETMRIRLEHVAMYRVFETTIKTLKPPYDPEAGKAGTPVA